MIAQIPENGQYPPRLAMKAGPRTVQLLRGIQLAQLLRFIEVAVRTLEITCLFFVSR